MSNVYKVNGFLSVAGFGVVVTFQILHQFELGLFKET